MALEPRRFALAALAVGSLAWTAACELPLTQPADGMAELRLTAVVAGTPINVLVVEVTAADITTPLVFNIPIVNGVAQGTIRIPPGKARTITVRGYDSDGNQTHEGSKTIDVKPGQNPPVSIPVVPRAGNVPITVTIGPVSVVVQPVSPTVEVGSTLQLSVTITAANGDVLAGPAEWATTNPAVATVDQTGKVTAAMPGTVDIVATFAGVAGVSHVQVGRAPQIAFRSTRDGNVEIYVMNADGTGVVRLTNNAASDFQPAWSPDGMRLAFVSDRGFDPLASFEIYVMNADGTGVVRLTNNAAFDVQPAWSPDGTKLAFTSDRDGNLEIYVMNADGTGVVRLTDNAANDYVPAWSPDGAKLAFTSDRDGNDEIYVMNADGTGLVRLTDNVADDAQPAWSPDGAKIAFSSTRDGNNEIYVMDADGRGLVRLTNTAAINVEPAWSRDGTKLAFASTRDGNFEIYVMNADGTGVVRLTNIAGADLEPRWRP